MKFTPFDDLIRITENNVVAGRYVNLQNGCGGVRTLIQSQPLSTRCDVNVRFVAKMAVRFIDV